MLEALDEAVEFTEDVLKLAEKHLTAALILAAGDSTRMGGKVSKQFIKLRLPWLGAVVLAPKSAVKKKSGK